MSVNGKSVAICRKKKAPTKAPFRMDGGAEGDRTPDLCNAIAALSQLSYGPIRSGRRPTSGGTGAWQAGKFRSPCLFHELMFVVVRGRFHAQIVVATQIDLVVGRGLFLFAQRFQILVLTLEVAVGFLGVRLGLLG